MGRPATRRAELVKHLLLTGLGLLFLLPFLAAVSTAFKRPSDVLLLPPRLMPHPVDIANFRQVLTSFPFAAWFRNSLIVSVLFTVGQLFSCSFMGFALSWLRFRGQTLLLLVILGTMMIPFQVIMVPTFLLMKWLGWLDTLYPLWVPAFFGGLTGAFGVFLMRQAFLGLPRELIDSGMIDGCQPLQLYWYVCLPPLRAYLAVLGVLSFMTSWNDFLKPILFITSINRMTVTGGMSFFQAEWHVDWGSLTAGALVSVVPTVLLYLMAQRYFVDAAVTSGLKG
jgi:multiple sugar transport system permease protein